MRWNRVADKTLYKLEQAVYSSVNLRESYVIGVDLYVEIKDHLRRSEPQQGVLFEFLGDTVGAKYRDI